MFAFKIYDMQKKNLIYEGAVAVILFAAVSYFLAEFAPYRLGFKEQISMSLLSVDHLKWYFSHPASLAAIAGDWLTQFYWFKGAAITITVLLLAMVWLGLAMLLKRAGSKRPVVPALLPVLTEMSLLTWLNYPVSATLSMAAAIWMGVLLAGRNRMVDMALLCVGVPLLYVAVGAHAFTFALAVMLFRFRDGASWMAFVAGLILMLGIGRMYNISFIQSLISPIPTGFVTPAILWMSSSILAVIVSMVVGLYADRIWITVPLVAALSGLSFWISVDKNIELSLDLATNAYKGNWDRVYASAARDHTGNMYATYYYNLCNARNGRLADGLFRRKQATSESLFLSVGQNSSYLSVFVYSDALLEMGDISQATDCALLGQTIMPGGYSTRMFRRLAEVSMVAGNYDVACKYLDMLAHTYVHGKWAREMKACITDSSNGMPEYILRWRARTAASDRLYYQGNWMSALTAIADMAPNNKAAVDYLLCGYLLDKKLGSFRSCYDRYYLNKLDRVCDVPEIFQQALLSEVTSQEAFDNTVERYSISDKTARDFMDFFGMASGRMNPDPHHDTYWYYVVATQLNPEEKK